MAHKIIASWLAGEALVVADGAAVLADPGDSPLHDPAAGQDLKCVRVALGDDLDGSPRLLGWAPQPHGSIRQGVTFIHFPNTPETPCRPCVPISRRGADIPGNVVAGE